MNYEYLETVNGQMDAAARLLDLHKENLDERCYRQIIEILDDARYNFREFNIYFVKASHDKVGLMGRDLSTIYQYLPGRFAHELFRDMNIMEGCKVTNAQSTIFSDINQDRALMYCVSAHFQHQSDNLAEVFVQRVES